MKNQSFIEKIIADLTTDCKECDHYCEEFILFKNNIVQNQWFARYRRTDVSGGTGREEFRWICYDLKGNRIECDPVFTETKIRWHFYNAMVLVKHLPNCKNNYQAITQKPNNV